MLSITKVYKTNIPIILFALCFFFVQYKAEGAPSELLSYITSFPDFQTGEGIIFKEQNPQKIKIIQEMLSAHELDEGVSYVKKNQDTFQYLKNKKKFHLPIIEFRRINPTKYRIRIHGAIGSFPLVFSERFHEDWNLYLVPLNFKKINLNNQNTQKTLSSYKTFSGNEKTQVETRKLTTFVKNGWITDLTADPPSITNPYFLIKRLFLNNSSQKKLTTSFISKRFANTIQNNNLPSKNFWETWFSGHIIINCDLKTYIKKECNWVDLNFWELKSSSNNNHFKWPNQLHWQANSLLNSWWIDTKAFPHLFLDNNQPKKLYRINMDNSIDFELVMEYWPQRLFYVGGVISLSTLTACFIVIFIRWIRH